MLFKCILGTVLWLTYYGWVLCNIRKALNHVMVVTEPGKYRVIVDGLGVPHNISCSYLLKSR